MSAQAAWVLVRPRRSAAGLAWLQLVASGTTTLLASAVAMLAWAFWRVPSDEVGYRILSVALVGLLLVPLVTLGAATARLAARSRDDRLATLRLLGATAGRVRRIAVAETTLIAAAGVLLGTLVSAGLPLALGLLTVHGEPLRVSDLWLPWWATAALPPSLMVIAALSALLGLRGVVLTPLGVRTRQDAPRLSWVRLALALLTVGAAVLVGQSISPGWGVVLAVAVAAAAVIAVMAVLGVAGPFAIAVVARRSAARTSDPVRLVAARGILDDPRAAWRAVSALALAVFVLIPAGCLLGYLNAIRNSDSRAVMTEEQLLLFDDARTMLLALTAVSFIVVACQAALTQTAAVLEQRELFVALDRIGVPRAELHRTRRLRVTMPANVAVIGAAVAACTVAFFLVFIAVAVAPLFVVAILVVLFLGLLLVRAGVTATAPVLRRVLDETGRGE